MSGATKRFHDAIQRLGGEAYLLRQGARLPFPACLLPRSGDSVSDSTPLGWGETKHYTLYAPTDSAATTLEPGDTVEYRDCRYRVRRVERRSIGGEDVYLWAVVRPETGGPA